MKLSAEIKSVEAVIKKLQTRYVNEPHQTIYSDIIILQTVVRDLEKLNDGK